MMNPMVHILSLSTMRESEPYPDPPPNERYRNRRTFRACRWNGYISVTTYRPYIPAWFSITKFGGTGTSCLRLLEGMSYPRKY